MTIKNIFTLSIFVIVAIHNLIGQQLLNKTLVHDGVTRSYTIYVPSSYQGETKIPLLFNFHGGNGDIASQIKIADMRPIADTAGFILVYPLARPDPNDGGSTIWTHKEPTTVDDIFFVEAMIDTIAADYLIDEDRVYACGYSNGGEFSFELACRLSNRIAAIGVVARSMFIETFENCAPTHPTAVLTIHGSLDDYNGITFGGITFYVSLDEVNRFWSTYNQTDVEPVIEPIPDINMRDGSTVEKHSWENGDACVQVEHLKVNGGGHDWPGSFGNEDINASVEIWNYVSQYNTQGLIACRTTSIPETIKERKILMYPNPVVNQLWLDLENNTQEKYYIYSTTGKLLQSGTMNAYQQTIDLSAIPASVYILKIGDRIGRFIKLQ